MSSYIENSASAESEHEKQEYSEEDGQKTAPALNLNNDLHKPAAEDPVNEDPAAENPVSEDSVDEERIPNLLGVRLYREGQVYFVAYSGGKIDKGTKILVELEQGVALGLVVALYYQKSTSRGECFVPDGTFRGFATAKDIAIQSGNKILAAEAAAFCKGCIRQRSLDMKLVDVVVLHDKSKIIFFFTAPTRIDFRELVKDLVNTYRTRIELRHIGVRHEAQRLGGLGNCGRVCCCHGFLRKFAPVTIRMAKEQNLFLNPAKLSGLCGRLLCCLSYEQANYEEFNKRCPRQARSYETELGTMRVLQNNIFSRKIICLSSKNEEHEFLLEEWEAISPRAFDSSGKPAELIDDFGDHENDVELAGIIDEDDDSDAQSKNNKNKKDYPNERPQSHSHHTEKNRKRSSN